MNNRDFLDCLKDSFVKFLETHSRSNEKLKVLHGAVAADLNVWDRSTRFNRWVTEKAKKAKSAGGILIKMLILSCFGIISRLPVLP